MQREHSAEKDVSGYPAFRAVTLIPCSCGSVRFEVIWPDGTPDVLHFGTLSWSLNPTQWQQLRSAHARVLPPGKGRDNA